MLLLGGGGLITRGLISASDFIGSANAKREICSTLKDSERQDLVGAETPTKLLDVEGALDDYTCRWATQDYKTDTLFVQAVSAPADEWAHEVKTTGPQVAAGAAPQRARRILKALSQPIGSPEDGCRLARFLFQMSGAADKAERFVSPSATSNGTPMMVAQSCVGGTYSAVMVTAPGLVLDPALARKAAQALRTVEARIA